MATPVPALSPNGPFNEGVLILRQGGPHCELEHLVIFFGSNFSRRSAVNLRKAHVLGKLEGFTIGLVLVG